jgi:hypothetical protein
VKLDQHISDLLYRYDCVVVPDFGGFLANYQPAKINSRTNTFSPPAKKVSFNRNLNSNDGLLASHIVQKYDVSYENALLSISNCVNDYQKELKLGKRVLIENVGVLYLDSGKNILFEPIGSTNYLSDAFGLEKFHVSPIEQIEVETKVIPIERHKKQKHLHPGRVAAAILLPIFFVGSALFFQEKENGKLGPIQLSSLGFDKVESSYIVRSEGPAFIAEESNDIEFNALIEDAKNRSFVELDLQPIVENFYVIGGCFSEETNASSFVKKLQKQGYPAKQINHFKKLHAVAYQGFTYESDAREFLARIKKDNSTSAWLLRK